MSQWSLTLISSNINLGSFSGLLLRELPWDREKEGRGLQNKEIGTESSEQRGWKANGEKIESMAFKKLHSWLIKLHTAKMLAKIKRFWGITTPVQPSPSKQTIRKDASSPPLTPFHIPPPLRHHYIERVGNKRWIGTAGMQVWLEDLQNEDQRAPATRREIRDFQGEHFKYSVECITPSGHSHSSITNWNHFNPSCVGLDPIGITSPSNGWGASWGPKKKHTTRRGTGKLQK